ncbi:class I SAM-dependent methyltransferase [Actinomycetospora endophytica]|uniref:Class I SAM-dependent methyltransferase n=1 Tax=Actinomycetospora endophytica TaxID=2291215 RepID=A0ABS8P7M1_9PSEU|nr:class I SAM-dependent methyltransferase [Actinomycetospora endophytica]MCD2194262.1 class I SAM-dependent methyltransferase [Actinomycetospora endophytica]
MTISTLDTDPVRTLLDEMLHAADAQEPELQALVSRVAAAGPISETALAPELREAWICVPREVGDLLATLVHATRARTVVEFGTSFGVSTTYLAAALRDNAAAGTVITTELEPTKAAVAAANLRRAGLDDLVDLRVGDALETLRDLPEVDLLLLDGWSELYLPVLRVVEPRLRPGALIIADDTDMLPEALVDYLAHVRGPGYRSQHLPLGDGLEMSVRL